MAQPSRPRIACFHGGGSRASVYNVQCAHLAKLLEPDFELVFFDGPFFRDAGPGVLPAFRGYEPFRSWFTQDSTGVELADGSGYDLTGRDGVERIWKLMHEKAQLEPGGPWVGVMGFSQGTRPAGGLLLDQQRRIASGEATADDADAGLKFGVMCMGAGAPMVAESAHRAESDLELVTIPTIHVHGLKDAVLPLSRHQLASYYDPKRSELFEVDYHHAMPWVKHEVEHLAHLIRTAYRENI
ncbi:uncharacterized protein BO97DRAFT_407741 [Aspergillus homomorphus CBS 101889]|uniref:Serine hydrolase domain-containing protein n=1 Tax=Aspergillus homomorphus (strain CBS 101889) TaxID=1450537 RepID=A0A395HPP2_ASPHC|nr:hypothetical protein BO97DRAFT_407741 [Aspergillus homomorphus CBS 101889]RAL09393.1 hypothetical protein BO97DRAFT_407741 [Aspergillus homomorphus CBS 101889]